ncbi:potassium/proton antiporter [Oscillospiraceae bacterium PP1C4]
MALNLLIGAATILLCILCNKLSNRIGVPMLLAFIAIGMLFGTDGLFKIPFENFIFAEQICSVALIFIIFYGGFGMKWSQAKPVAVKSILLSSIGVILTAVFTGAFCRFVLHADLLESMLIGSVLSSTDAASVFSILRSKKLNLKYGTASMLELESGSNDPCAYMLTVITLSVMSGKNSTGAVAYLIFAQIFFGAMIGVIIALAAAYFLEHYKFVTEGFDAAFVLAIAVLAYAIPAVIGGNGYLSTYIVGIILGNKNIKNKKSFVHFFDGITGLMQMLVFFLLGLLAFPSQIPQILLPSVAITLFLTFVARPLAVAMILGPAKSKLNQLLLVSWTGLRGATAIVFAIMAMVSEAYMKNDVFHITFCVVLFSIAFQGSLLPYVAKKLNMIDTDGDVLKTFSDYTEETNVQFIRLVIGKEHPWLGKPVKETSLPPNTLIVMILRNNESIIPNGDTQILCGDRIVISAPAFANEENVHLSEVCINDRKDWCGKTIASIDLPSRTLVIMIKRNDQAIIPDGRTILIENDVLILNSSR